MFGGILALYSLACSDTEAQSFLRQYDATVLMGDCTALSCCRRDMYSIILQSLSNTYLLLLLFDSLIRPLALM